MHTINDKIITKTRLIETPINTIWWQWTTHEGLLTFFGQDNKVELCLGGAYEIYFLLDNPEGLRGGEGNKILSYLPNKMLSFTWNAPPEHLEILLRNSFFLSHYSWSRDRYSAEISSATSATFLPAS